MSKNLYAYRLVIRKDNYGAVFSVGELEKLLDELRSWGLMETVFEENLVKTNTSVITFNPEDYKLWGTYISDMRSISKKFPHLFFELERINPLTNYYKCFHFNNGFLIKESRAELEWFCEQTYEAKE